MKSIVITESDDHAFKLTNADHDYPEQDYPEQHFPGFDARSREPIEGVFPSSTPQEPIEYIAIQLARSKGPSLPPV